MEKNKTHLANLFLQNTGVSMALDPNDCHNQDGGRGGIHALHQYAPSPSGPGHVVAGRGMRWRMRVHRFYFKRPPNKLLLKKICLRF